ncbi:MAG: methylenetetrahydrofolate--tRNA-(uracil(54)-C(5))-methyltransferase (FADH(2)-oxidizing) TrmFO [Anaerolineales bacterium]|nr:methylenetetrahydrofolate--tRNA-(uracil(54)-C(5))-methyltransferase (FADH(2)-oxidizing) TrmFO [Anaerolineales bacterium]
MNPQPDLTIVGGGLAGSEAAWQAARLGLRVRLVEMRPQTSTGAHQTSDLAELVCSNSLGSTLPDRASGVLKEELRRLGSLLLDCAEANAVPAGAALAVDRDLFARQVTGRISSQSNIEIVRAEVKQIPPGPAIIASGPLTSPRLSRAIASLTGEEHLFFYDAIAPIVSRDSVNMEIAFRASRYGTHEQEEGDYINCPLNQEEYEAFVDALLEAERIPLRGFESEIHQGVRAGPRHFFEGCLPVEVIAGRGREALAYGPMRPVGLRDPRTGRWPHAVVQLRQDNLAASLYNLVGFQTNLTYPEQKRLLRMVPGLERAEFVRFGQMHRNTFIASPRVLGPSLQFRSRPDLFFAGQITGVEGYLGNIATGLLAGLNAARLLQNRPPLILPATTMLGALCHYVTHANLKDFQPMKANFGILPPLDLPVQLTSSGKPRRIGKRARAGLLAERALASLDSFLNEF